MGRDGIGGVSAGPAGGSEQERSSRTAKAGAELRGGVQVALRESDTTKLMSHVCPGVPTLRPARSPCRNPGIWKGGRALHCRPRPRMLNTYSAWDKRNHSSKRGT